MSNNQPNNEHVQKRFEVFRESALLHCAEVAVSRTLELMPGLDEPAINQLHASRDFILHAVKVARHYYEGKPIGDEELEKAIKGKESIRIGRPLDPRNDSDKGLDLAAQVTLGNLEGAGTSYSKRYDRYGVVIGLDDPASNLLMVITRREIDLQEPMELGKEVLNPHGAHYSMVFQKIPRLS